MAQFSFTLIGTTQPLVMDVEASGLADLNELLCGGRFLQGEIIATTGELTRALLPVSRIQFVAEMVE